MQLSKAPLAALLQLDRGNPDGSSSFWHFRHRGLPLIGEPRVAMIPYCGRTVGIEPDG